MEHSLHASSYDGANKDQDWEGQKWDFNYLM